MPVRLLTDAERERLSGFLREIPTEDLHAHFTLTGRDGNAIPSTSAPANRLGFALSLCAVRYLGFCPEDPSGCPEQTSPRLRDTFPYARRRDRRHKEPSVFSARSNQPQRPTGP